MNGISFISLTVQPDQQLLHRTIYNINKYIQQKKWCFSQLQINWIWRTRRKGPSVACIKKKKILHILHKLEGMQCTLLFFSSRIREHIACIIYQPFHRWRNNNEMWKKIHNIIHKAIYMELVRNEGTKRNESIHSFKLSALIFHFFSYFFFIILRNNDMQIRNGEKNMSILFF